MTTNKEPETAEQITDRIVGYVLSEEEFESFKDKDHPQDRETVIAFIQHIILAREKRRMEKAAEIVDKVYDMQKLQMCSDFADGMRLTKQCILTAITKLPEGKM